MVYCMNNRNIVHGRSKPISIGLVGSGYWGLKLAQRFSQMDDVRIAGVFDPDKNRQQMVSGVLRLPIINNADKLIARPDIDAVVIASPASTHFRYTMLGLNNNKHIFVEKPMTLLHEEALTILRLAEKRKRIVLVDHTYLYSNEVQTLKHIIERGDLGHIYAAESFRMGSSSVRDDCDVVWDLGVHDVAIFRHLFGLPLRVSASGVRHHSAAITDRATITMQFAKDLYGTIAVGWLYPDKIRSISIVGTRGALLFDDTKHKGKITVYDTPFHRKDGKKPSRRVIRIAGSHDAEPLQRACEDFIASVRLEQKPHVGAVDGVEVVVVLAACERSMAHRQRWEPI